MSGTPPPDGSDPRPAEPFVKPGAPRSFIAITNPTALVVWGTVVVVVGGFVLPGLLFAVAPRPTPAGAQVGFVVFGLVLLALGVLTIWAGVRRRRWLREVAEWDRRHGSPS